MSSLSLLSYAWHNRPQNTMPSPSSGLIYITFAIILAPKLTQQLLIQKGKPVEKPLRIDATLDMELT
jgi:hypothetical protein